MSKPIALPEWDTNQTNLVDPPPGYKANGWTNGEPVDSSFFNWYMNLVYQWLAWLDAGVLEGTSLDLSGDLNVGGNLSVDGDVTVCGDIEADNVYFNSTRTEQLDIHGTTYGATSFGTSNSGDKQSTGASQIVDIPITLPLGAQIWGYSFRYRGNGTNDLTHKLVKITDGTEIDVGTTTITAPPATWATAFNNFAPEHVSLGTRYVIRVTSGGSGQRVGAPTVDWTP